MTWDPRDLGAPRRVTHPPAPPEPPAIPPRPYELLLADWDDARVAAERAGMAFLEPLPDPLRPEDEPLFATALQEVLQRDIFKLLSGRVKNTLSADGVKGCIVETVERVSLPMPQYVGVDWAAGGDQSIGTHRNPDETPEQFRDRMREAYKMCAAPAPLRYFTIEKLPMEGSFDVRAGELAGKVLAAPVGAEIKQNGEPLGVVTGVDGLPDGSTRVRFQMGSSKPLNNFMNDFIRKMYPLPSIDHGDTRSQALTESHRVLVERPAQTLRDQTDEVDLADWLEDDYRGADGD